MLIVRIGKSEAEVTNNKRLRSRDCIVEAITIATCYVTVARSKVLWDPCLDKLDKSTPLHSMAL